jgi:hypothetical protein
MFASIELFGCESYAQYLGCEFCLQRHANIVQETPRGHIPIRLGGAERKEGRDMHKFVSIQIRR